MIICNKLNLKTRETNVYKNINRIHRWRCKKLNNYDRKNNNKNWYAITWLYNIVFSLLSRFNFLFVFQFAILDDD